MKRVLVMTGTTDIGRTPNDTDSMMEEVFDLTLPSKQRYAKKHGYDLLSMRSFGEDKESKFSHTNNHQFYVGFLRAMWAFRMIESYDVVMWIDADSIITNQNYKVEDFGLNEEQSFYASYDWEWMRSFSTGNFIVNKTVHTQKLIDEFYRVCSHFPHEQATLNGICYQTNLRNTFRILEHRYLGSIPSMDICKKYWGSRPQIHWPWDENCFLVHVGGLKNQHRIEIMKNHFSKYI